MAELPELRRCAAGAARCVHRPVAAACICHPPSSSCRGCVDLHAPMLRAASALVLRAWLFALLGCGRAVSKQGVHNGSGLLQASQAAFLVCDPRQDSPQLIIVRTAGVQGADALALSEVQAQAHGRRLTQLELLAELVRRGAAELGELERHRLPLEQHLAHERGRIEQRARRGQICSAEVEEPYHAAHVGENGRGAQAAVLQHLERPPAVKP